MSAQCRNSLEFMDRGARRVPHPTVLFDRIFIDTYTYTVDIIDSRYFCSNNMLLYVNIVITYTYCVIAYWGNLSTCLPKNIVIKVITSLPSVMTVFNGKASLNENIKKSIRLEFHHIPSARVKNRSFGTVGVAYLDDISRCVCFQTCRSQLDIACAMRHPSMA